MKLFQFTIVFLILLTSSVNAVDSKDLANCFKVTASTDEHKCVDMLVETSIGILKLKTTMGQFILSPPYRIKVSINPENKLYYPLALYGIGPADTIYTVVSKLKGPILVRLLNRRCKKYTFKIKNPSGQILDAELITTDSLKLSKQLNSAICRVFAIKNIYEFPVKISAKLKSGKELIIFSVSKIERTKVDKKMFLIPPSYKKAKSFAAFIFSQSGTFDKNEFDELFRSRH